MTEMAKITGLFSFLPNESTYKEGEVNRPSPGTPEMVAFSRGILPRGSTRPSQQSGRQFAGVGSLRGGTSRLLVPVRRGRSAFLRGRSGVAQAPLGDSQQADTEDR